MNTSHTHNNHESQIKDGCVQRIHTRLVVSQIALANLLSRQYGKGNFAVEASWRYRNV